MRSSFAALLKTMRKQHKPTAYRAPIKFPVDFIIVEMGGKSYHLDGRERARMLVRLRDRFTCQSCKEQRTIRQAMKMREHGEPAKLYDVHHLNGMCGKRSVGYDSPKDDLSQLITLCHKCHYNHHQFSKNFAKAKTQQRKAFNAKRSYAASLMRSGLSNNEIATKMGYSREYVRQLLNEVGLVNPNKRPKPIYTRICKRCNTTFTLRYKSDTQQHCSAKCYNIGRRKYTPAQRAAYHRQRVRAWYLRMKDTPEFKAATKARNNGKTGISIYDFKPSR